MRLPKILTITITVLILGLFTPIVDAAVADVYLVYSGKDRMLKKDIIEELSGNFSVKTYNASLLGLADYSGIQKVVGKISRARVAVMLFDTTMEAFKGNTIRTNLIVVNSVKTTVRTQHKLRYIIDTSVDISKLGKELKTSIISSMAELNDTGADVLIIDESTINITKVLKAVMNEQLNQVKR